MKWAVVGSLGMLGRDLLKFLTEIGEEAVGFHRGNMNLKGESAEVFAKFAGFDLIVNCVAYTKVDQAELERQEAFFANALFPSLLAQIADEVGAKLIHISTDYVFDGNFGTAYAPSSTKNPKSAYGETKSIGEDLVLAFANCQVVRTSWLYGAQGNSFPKAIATKLLAGESVSVVDDQIGSPTYTRDLAKFIYLLGKSETTDSILHGVSSGSTSWFGFAQEIASKLEQLSAKAKSETTQPDSFLGQLTATSTEMYVTAAKRPAYSVLIPSSVDGFAIPDWNQCWSTASDLVLADFIHGTTPQAT